MTSSLYRCFSFHYACFCMVACQFVCRSFVICFAFPTIFLSSSFGLFKCVTIISRKTHGFNVKNYQSIDKTRFKQIHPVGIRILFANQSKAIFLSDKPDGSPGEPLLRIVETCVPFVFQPEFLGFFRVKGATRDSPWTGLRIRNLHFHCRKSLPMTEIALLYHCLISF